MTNYERIIKQMTVEELAGYMVNCSYMDNGDYSYDGEDEYWVENWQDCYFSCANDCLYTDFEEAKEDLIKWLNMESKV